MGTKRLRPNLYGRGWSPELVWIKFLFSQIVRGPHLQHFRVIATKIVSSHHFLSLLRANSKEKIFTRSLTRWRRDRSRKIRQSTSCSIEQSPLLQDFFAIDLLRGARLCIIQKQDSCGDRMKISQAIVAQSSREKEYHKGKALRIRGDSSLLSLRTSSLHRDGSSRSQKKPYSLRCWAHRWY